MEEMIRIRKEEESDYERVEKITRQAFWNLYVPGCVEHYLVHVMRSHEDFLPELDLVIEVDGQVIGNIMYTKAKLVDESGMKKRSSPSARFAFCRNTKERVTGRG